MKNTENGQNCGAWIGIEIFVYLYTSHIKLDSVSGLHLIPSIQMVTYTIVAPTLIKGHGPIVDFESIVIFWSQRLNLVIYESFNTKIC